MFSFAEGSTEPATPYEFLLYSRLAQHAESVWQMRELFGKPPSPEAAALANQLVKVVQITDPASPESELFVVKLYEVELLRFTFHDVALAFAERLKVPLRESLDGFAAMREAHRILKSDKPH